MKYVWTIIYSFEHCARAVFAEIFVVRAKTLLYSFRFIVPFPFVFNLYSTHMQAVNTSF